MFECINLANSNQCTGCGACKEKCPKGAIVFSPDDEGFPSPIIQENLCVGCGLCSKVCPQLNKPETNLIIKAYAAQIIDKDILKDSTSGGLFTAFSREIFHQGGVVYGCVWDENYHAVVRKAENEEEIKPMRGSKYVWSWAGDSFPEIKAYLDSGRLVLFSGLPCQVAGLKNYLSKKYENLYLVDFLCSGSPSPLALDKYLDSICKREERKNLNLKFRDKVPYGVGVHITYKGKRKIIKKGEHIRNPYYWSFYTRLVDRKSCYKCDYGSGNRLSDITLGDYWGISDFHNELNIRDGVSAILVNTEKGESLIQSLKDDIKLIETDPNNIAKANNLFIGNKKRTIHEPRNREQFFVLLKNRGWQAAERKYLVTFGRFVRIVKVMLPPKLSRLICKIIK